MKNSFIFSFFLSVVKRSYDVEITENTDWFSNIRQIDEEYHANVTNNVGSRASIQQGKCYLRVIHETFCDNLDLERIEMIRKGIQTGLRTHPLTHSLVITHSLNYLSHLPPYSGLLHGHYAVIFGIIVKMLNISYQMTERIFMRCLVRDLLSSSYRLNIIGPMEGSKIQNEFIPIIENILQQYIYKNTLIPIQTSPILEILQARHDLLYARLFNS